MREECRSGFNPSLMPIRARCDLDHRLGISAQLYLIASAVLGAVEGLIGTFEHLMPAFVAGLCRHTDGYRDFGSRWILDRLTQALGSLLGCNLHHKFTLQQAVDPFLSRS